MGRLYHEAVGEPSDSILLLVSTRASFGHRYGMRIEVISLFPELIEVPMQTSIMKRARESGLVEFAAHDLRKHGLGRHAQVDDTPCGGGPGMVLRPEPLFAMFEEIHRPGCRVVHLSPAGRPLRQADAERLSKEPHLIFLSGHYEGIDQRVIDRWVDEEISLGDYVLTNGTVAAAVVIDAIVRLLPGALGDEQSPIEESFGASGLLEAPQYTKPAEFQGFKVPDVLLSGHHAKIATWRQEQSVARTARVRPDLLRSETKD
jgi:tRNA (guanine37-N1)-methyltransferase